MEGIGHGASSAKLTWRLVRAGRTSGRIGYRYHVSQRHFTFNTGHNTLGLECPSNRPRTRPRRWPAARKVRQGRDVRASINLNSVVGHGGHRDKVREHGVKRIVGRQFLPHRTGADSPLEARCPKILPLRTLCRPSVLSVKHVCVFEDQIHANPCVPGVLGVRNGNAVESRAETTFATGRIWTPAQKIPSSINRRRDWETKD
jgi:hypothetical protein